ncbi:MAG: hypothetical protein Q8P05_06345 [Candidatus Diapherotrites archaeon]|nr:hypothetical protein [Candidatus Diapherotrites archaeon]
MQKLCLDCKIVMTDGAKIQAIRCPVHDAEPDLYAALLWIMNRANNVKGDLDSYNYVVFDVAEEARAALDAVALARKTS